TSAAWSVPYGSRPIPPGVGSIISAPADPFRALSAARPRGIEMAVVKVDSSERSNYQLPPGLFRLPCDCHQHVSAEASRCEQAEGKADHTGCSSLGGNAGEVVEEAYNPLAPV